MLAIKTILADADQTPVLVFDEIDTGVSGRTAVRLGERLAMLASRHQVFCVTHLAQIASMADQHLLISKQTDGQTTYTRLDMLREAERRGELARLLSGDSGRNEALVLAAQLREEAERFKSGSAKETSPS
jgi:DNA repair protein RecN (Recombination protein N)